MAKRIIDVTARLRKIDPPSTAVVERVLKVIVSAICFEPSKKTASAAVITFGTSGENPLENFVRFRAHLTQAVEQHVTELLEKHIGQPFAIGYGGGKAPLPDQLVLKRLQNASFRLSRLPRR
jgi:hypothetical protein